MNKFTVSRRCITSNLPWTTLNVFKPVTYTSSLLQGNYKRQSQTYRNCII